MKLHRLALISGLLFPAVLVPAESATAVEVVKDGSFESTPPAEDNPNWEEGWVAFPPICDVDTCGDGGGTAGPRTGKNWVWFGGTFGPELQFVAQEVTIPAGIATLTFYLKLGASSGNGMDAFWVYMDDVQLLEVLESASGYGTYTLVTLDVTSFAGTGPHRLSIEFEGSGGPPTNFFLDDISLQSV